MTSNTPPTLKSGLLGGRRLVLLGTTILSLGAAALIVAPDAARHGAFAQNVTQQAQTRRASDRLCRHCRKGQTGRYFRSREGRSRTAIVVRRRRQRVRRPDLSASSAASARRMPGQQGQGQRNPRGGGGRNFSTGQGSGFFISADGYAVTNNHVVDKADSVEITTDDGKTYHRQSHRHRSAHRPGADQGRRRKQFPVRQARRDIAAHRRLGAGGRQSVRPRRHRDRGHRVRARPRYRRRSV